MIQRLSRDEIEKVTFAFYRHQLDNPGWPSEDAIQDIACKFQLSIPAVRDVVKSIEEFKYGSE